VGVVIDVVMEVVAVEFVPVPVDVVPVMLEEFTVDEEELLVRFVIEVDEEPALDVEIELHDVEEFVMMLDVDELVDELVDRVDELVKELVGRVEELDTEVVDKFVLRELVLVDGTMIDVDKVLEVFDDGDWDST
jgi:hypothetical protein